MQSCHGMLTRAESKPELAGRYWRAASGGAAGSQDGALNTARAPSPHWLMRRATATMSSGNSTDLSGSKSLGAQGAQGAQGGCTGWVHRVGEHTRTAAPYGCHWRRSGWAAPRECQVPLSSLAALGERSPGVRPSHLAASVEGVGGEGSSCALQGWPSGAGPGCGAARTARPTRLARWRTPRGTESTALTKLAVERMELGSTFAWVAKG